MEGLRRIAIIKNMVEALLKISLFSEMEHIYRVVGSSLWRYQVEKRQTSYPEALRNPGRDIEKTVLLPTYSVEGPPKI